MCLLLLSQKNSLFDDFKVNVKKCTKFYIILQSPYLMYDFHVKLSFITVQHYEGVIELCMKSALLKDENNLALHFHMSPHTVEELDNMDPAFKYAYSAR